MFASLHRAVDAAFNQMQPNIAHTVMSVGHSIVILDIFACTAACMNSYILTHISEYINWNLIVTLRMLRVRACAVSVPRLLYLYQSLMHVPTCTGHINMETLF